MKPMPSSDRWHYFRLPSLEQGNFSHLSITLSTSPDKGRLSSMYHSLAQNRMAGSLFRRRMFLVNSKRPGNVSSTALTTTSPGVPCNGHGVKSDTRALAIGPNGRLACGHRRLDRDRRAADATMNRFAEAR
jgi:hypothetical protein